MSGMGDKFLSIEEAAKLLGVDYKTIYRLVRSGEIPAARIGRVYRIKRKDLDEFFERYEDASGIKIDVDRLDFYMLLHHFKAFGITATAAGAFRTNHKLNLKIGAFAMMQYAALAGLVKEINSRYAGRKTGA